MSDDYAREKLGAAVDSLASSAAPIQKRLEYAWMAMHTLRTHGLGDPERDEEYRSIYDRLTADKSDQQAGSVAKTCAGLRDDEAVEIARDIVALEGRLTFSRIYQLEEQLLALKATRQS